MLVRIGVQFIPDKATVTREVHRLAKTSPASAIFSQKLMDHEGRPIAEIGSVEGDLDGRVVRQTSQHMQFEIPWLRAVVDRMRERLKPNGGRSPDSSLDLPGLRRGQGTDP